MPGLTASEVIASRALHGTNVLTPPPRTPGWKLYLEKFDDPVIRILMIAATLAILVGLLDGKVAEGVGILLAILLATFLAFWNEHRAAREFDILNTTSDDIPAKAFRDGGYTLVPRRDVVVGDSIFIEVGEEVPADGVLFEATSLQVNESKLTGEAVPADKVATMTLFRGTTVVDGFGVFTVEAIGDRTEIGQTLRESIIETGDETPLNRQLAKLSQIIGVVGFGIALLAFIALFVHGLLHGSIHLTSGEMIVCAALALGGSVAMLKIWLPIVYDARELLGFTSTLPAWIETGAKPWLLTLTAGIVLFCLVVAGGIATGFVAPAPTEWLSREDIRQLLRNFMIAVTIIVVAVPEGLAMSVTLSLAYSMRKMTASNTLVRRMQACETIGAATVICTDKTGTLTKNEMHVAEGVVMGLASSARHERWPPRLAEAVAVNSTAHLSGDDSEAIGNPTECALLRWLNTTGLDYRTIRESFAIQAQWTFNTERKFMATLGKGGHIPVLHVKGAPEIILNLCSTILHENGIVPLDNLEREKLQQSMQQFQSRGMRTLALAFRQNPGDGTLEELATDLCWLGLIAIADPVRKDVPDAIAACRAAGVDVKIVTGDSPETAREIARQIGLADAEAVTGPEFAVMTDDEASTAAARLTILARARPADKLRLVRLLKARGEVVAVTGDGVNDGPALNAADVGLAMGRTGTAVAREASDIILLDDSFPSIVNAIRWGRSLYENIQRFILFQLTINVAALGLAVLGPFLGYELPLTVMQMLWINLIMDTFAALALATEPPHDAVLTRTPRSPDAFIVTPAMARMIFATGLSFLVLLIGLIVYLQMHDELPHDDTPSRGSTILFTTFVLLQFWNLFNAKALGRPGSVLPTLGNNPSFLLIAVAILMGQILLVQFGGTVFRTVPLSVNDWLLLIASTSCVLWLGELFRWRG